MRQGKRHITHYTYDSTNQLVSAANPQTYALSVTYGDWGKIQEYGLSQTDLASNTTTGQTRYYSYGSLNEGQTTFPPNSISYADGTDVNEQYGINGSLQRREINRPGSPPETEHYRFGADGNLRLCISNHQLPPRPNDFCQKIECALGRTVTRKAWACAVDR